MTNNAATHEWLRSIFNCKKTVEKYIGPMPEPMELEQVIFSETIETNLCRKIIKCTQGGGAINVEIQITVNYPTKTAEVWFRVNGSDEVQITESVIQNGFRLSTHYVHHDAYDVVVEVTYAPEEESNIPNDLTLFHASINTQGKTIKGSFNRSDLYPEIFDRIRKEITPPSASLTNLLTKAFNPSVIGTTRGAYGGVLIPPAEPDRTPGWASAAGAILMDALHCNWACTATFAAVNALIVMG